MKNQFLAYCLLAAATSAPAADCVRNSYGDAVCGGGQCATDQYGKVFCAKDGGGAMRDQYGDVKCGVGYCAANDEGQILCSRKPSGGAATDSSGKVKCVGGCRSGTQKLCEVAR